MHQQLDEKRDAPPRRRARAQRSLRIGIDGTCLGSWRGYGRFLRELLPPLLADDAGHEYILFLDAHTAEQVGPIEARTVISGTRQGQAEAASATGRRGLADMWRMGRAVAREALDVMYFPSVYSYYPVPSRVPVVVGFHDTIAERHGRVVFPSRTTRLAWQAKVALARWQASAMITVSDWSQASLADYFGLRAESIFVTPEAPSPAFFVSDERTSRDAAGEWLAARGLAAWQDYFIYVGGFNPHKNLIRTLDAFAACAVRTPSRRLGLLLVGDHEGDNFHADVDALRTRIARLGLDEQVHFAGFVPDETLRPLYARALALLIPSLEEGFGLPAVEAAACGTPCVATRNSPLPGLLEKGGLFVDPENGAALESALQRIAGDATLREQLAAAALERSRGLNWRATAIATREALETVARGERR